MSKFANAVYRTDGNCLPPRVRLWTRFGRPQWPFPASSAQRPRTELDDSLTRLADSVATAEMPGAAIVALCCGAIVERGGNPDVALDAVLSRLPETLSGAQLFAEACEEAAADDDDRLESTENVDDNENKDPVEKFGERIALQMPDNVNAYNAVEPLGAAAIALLSRSPAGRRAARASVSPSGSAGKRPGAVSRTRQLSRKNP